MKEHVLRYLIDGNGWWCGINITNAGYLPTIVLIDYFADNGTVAKAVDGITLGPGCQKKFNVSLPYGWARALSNDGVLFSVFYGRTDSSFFQGVEVTPGPVVIGNLVRLDTTNAAIQIKPFCLDCAAHKYLTVEYRNILNLLAFKSYLDYPARQDKKLHLADGCAESGDTPGHPPGSHVNGTSVDLHYYTKGAANHTQPDGQITPVNIWTDGKLNAMFDVDRNMDFYLSYLKCFPKAIVYIDRRIKTAMEMELLTIKKTMTMME